MNKRVRIYHQKLSSVPESRLENRAMQSLTSPAAASMAEVFEEQKLGQWGSCIDGGYCWQWELSGPTCLDVGFEEVCPGQWGSWRVERFFCRMVRVFRVVLGWTVLVWVPGMEWSETSLVVGEAAPQLDIIAAAVVVAVVPVVGTAAALVGDLPCR